MNVSRAVVNNIDEYICFPCFDDFDKTLCQTSGKFIQRRNINPRTLTCINCEHPEICHPQKVCANPTCTEKYTPQGNEVYCEDCLELLEQGICLQCKEDGSVLSEFGVCEDCLGDGLCTSCGSKRVKYIGGICKSCQRKIENEFKR